jgi:hypothetical protein
VIKATQKETPKEEGLEFLEEEKQENKVEKKMVEVDVVHKELPSVKKEEKVKIIIEEQEGDEHSPFVFVSVNGYAYSIRRGFEVEVPKSVVHALENAVQTKMYQDVDSGEITYKNVPRFNYRIIG